jgi:indole-3-glycerol phosphate synthase
VTSVRGIVGLPVLVKDFIVDPYQIVEARNAGADAVLLIVRILDWDRLVSLLELAHALGMSALVECHDENDVRTALKARSPIVGINNRDLDTLRVDLETTERLSRLIPAGVVLVAESGIHTRRDIERLSAAGAGAFLVGGALLDAPDAGAKLRELRGVALIPEGKGS